MIMQPRAGACLHEMFRIPPACHIRLCYAMHACGSCTQVMLIPEAPRCNWHHATAPSVSHALSSLAAPLLSLCAPAVDHACSTFSTLVHHKGGISDGTPPNSFPSKASRSALGCLKYSCRKLVALRSSGVSSVML